MVVNCSLLKIYHSSSKLKPFLSKGKYDGSGKKELKVDAIDMGKSSLNFKIIP